MSRTILLAPLHAFNAWTGKTLTHRVTTWGTFQTFTATDDAALVTLTEVGVKWDNAHERSHFAFLTVTVRKGEASGTTMHYSVATLDTNELKTAPGECGTEHSGILENVGQNTVEFWRMWYGTQWNSGECGTEHSGILENLVQNTVEFWRMWYRTQWNSGECGTEHSGILNCGRILVTRQWTHCQTSRWRNTNS